MTHTRSFGGTLLAVTATVLISPTTCPAQEPPARTTRWVGPLPGGKPGTFQYLAQLRTRSFSPAQVLTLARRQADPIVRKGMLDSLATLAAQDQAEVHLAVEGMGGTWKASHWAANVMHCDLLPQDVARLAAHARVLKVWPNEAHEPSDAPGASAPLYDSVKSENHNALGAKNPLVVPIKQENAARIAGKDVTIGFFDTGLDVDGAYAGPPTPNHCFLDSIGTTYTRFLGSFLVGGTMIAIACPGGGVLDLPPIDCNDPMVHPFSYQAGAPQKHVDARHGTGVAAIAAGRSMFVPNQADGHAPDAAVVCWSLSHGFAQPGYCGGIRWLTDDASYLNAIQALLTWNASAPQPVRILNISWSGTPYPDEPVQVALDALATDFDILVVIAASNQGDSTSTSHGMHNGLSVGAVQKMPPTGYKQTVPWIWSSRGPLQGDPDRYYPDMCAVGVDVWKAHVDDGNTAGNVPASYVSSGTSLAAPQVSGAAALYMARRLGYTTQGPATALETKAALLVNTADAYNGYQSPVAIHTYHHRNAWGIGFLRDDYLCEYAERHGSDQIIASHLGAVIPAGSEVVTVSPSAPLATVTYGPLVVAPTQEDYVIGIAWDRPSPDYSTGIPQPLANVDLEVWNANQTTLLARSATPRNSYEHVVFKATGLHNANVMIRVVGTDLQGQTVPVHVAARLNPESQVFPSPGPRYAASGSVDVLPQPCNPGGMHPTDQVGRVVPTSYVDAYGSYAFGFAPYTGWTLPTTFHTIYQSSVLGGGFTANGAALRSWAPFNTASSTAYQVQFVRLVQVNTANPVIPVVGQFNTVYAASTSKLSVVGTPYTVNLPTGTYPPKQIARSWNEWSVPIPFQTPFTYSPFHTEGPHLAVWMEINSGVNLSVDTIDDSPGSPVATAWPGQAAWPGRAPMLGLVLSGSAAPTLACYGAPEVGQTILLHALNFGTNPSGIAGLLIGPGLFPPQPLTPPAGNCLLQWTGATPVVLPWIPSSGSTLTGVAFPSGPGLLYTEIYAQVAEFTTGYAQSTNGLRIRIGGRY